MKRFFFAVLFLLAGVSTNTALAQIVRNWVNAALQVVSPLPDKDPSPNGYTLTPNNQVVITVTFNRSVNPATVIVGNTVIMDFPEDHNAAASLAWSNDNKTLTVTTLKTKAELLSQTKRDYFALKLIGSIKPVLRVNGNPPSVLIQSADGHVFDGDFDQKDGGDFTVSFVVFVPVKRH